MAAVPAPPAPDPNWVFDATRGVSPGGYYRFGVAAASNLTSDQVLAALVAQGWNTKSIGQPTPDVAAALSGLSTMGLTNWEVYALWNGAATTIPDSAAPLFYGALEQYVGTPPGQPEPTQPTIVLPETLIEAPLPESVLPNVLGFLAGISLAAAAFWYVKSRDIHL
jgi:hypothetical protein